MTLYFASFWAHFLGPFSRNLLICLALPFLADSFERLITAQLRGNCTLRIDQAIFCVDQATSVPAQPGRGIWGVSQHSGQAVSTTPWLEVGVSSRSDRGGTQVSASCLGLTHHLDEYRTSVLWSSDLSEEVDASTLDSISRLQPE